MAIRRRSVDGMPPIPNALSQGKSVFPITTFRALLQPTTQGTNVEQVIDLDLQFEDNEVLDVWSMKVDASMLQDTAADAASELEWAVALFEDPDKALATNIFSEETFEDDSSLIHHEAGVFYVNFTTAAGFEIGNLCDSRYFVFPQPYTVARNLKVIAGMLGTQTDLLSMSDYVTIWGRRRNANDAEFKNIIYRQRF